MEKQHTSTLPTVNDKCAVAIYACYIGMRTYQQGHYSDDKAEEQEETVAAW